MTRSARWPNLPLRRFLVPASGLAEHFDALPAPWVRSLAVVATGLCLLWPSLFNAQYIFFYDTIGYLRGAVQAFEKAGIESAWSALYDNQAEGTGAQAATAAGLDSHTDGYVSAARSVYYGIFLYVSELLGSLWFAVLFQLLAVSLAAYLTLRALLGPSGYELAAILCCLGVFTPLSFYVGYLMPDVFAGIVILACATLLVYFDRLEWWPRSLWFALLAVSLTFHMSFIAVAVALTIPGILVVRATMGRFPLKAAGVIHGAVALGILSQLIFFRAVEAAYGHPPLHPPFLMARVIADGPGYRYLRETCPANGFKICEFLPVLPLGADEFLWSKDPRSGVIGSADPETRRTLAAQQMAFVSEVLRHDPAGQVKASLQGIAEQLSRFSIREFDYSDAMRKMVEENLPAYHRDGFRNSLLYRGLFPTFPVDILFHLAIAVSALFLIWNLPGLAAMRRNLATATGRARNAGEKMITFCLVVLAGVIANAAVTGVLSTPHDRYQARVVWLIPLLALSLFFYVRRKRAAVPGCARKKMA